MICFLYMLLSFGFGAIAGAWLLGWATRKGWTAYISREADKTAQH